MRTTASAPSQNAGVFHEQADPDKLIFGDPPVRLRHGGRTAGVVGGYSSASRSRRQQHPARVRA
ncbi:hypothetical protein ACFP2T_45940 [Plantactinospora solaniradicis]|uniref:Uncharacterized protein n=1 Tax=Plantactinospora solaniradicis TaxID=1723736 RepID=A0ABW1KQU4_9ACTN